MKRLLSLFSVLFILGSLALAGCGGGGASGAGGGSTTSRGVVQVRLQWPERRSRQVPSGANSVRIVMRTSDGQELVNRLLIRPSVDTTTTEEAITGLPQAILKVEATAYPNADGSGTAQAHLSTYTNVSSGQATDLDLTMDSTIARVDIEPGNIPLSAAPVTVTAAAYDASGNRIMTDAWSWSNSNQNVIRMTPDGGAAILTAVGPGSTSITLTETESGKSITRTFNVAPLN